MLLCADLERVTNGISVCVDAFRLLVVNATTSGTASRIREACVTVFEQFTASLVVWV